MIYKTILLTLLFLITLKSQMIQVDSLNRALSGYDVVNYYKDSTARIGDTALSVTFYNVTWLFISKENRELFIQNPELYLPQYGGFCSWGMKFGGTYDADHLRFTIYKEKLYFNQDERIERWWRNKKEWNINKADRKWKKLKDPE